MNEYIFDKDKLKDGMVFKNILEICDIMGFDKKNVKPNNNKGKAIKRSLDTVCKWHEVKNGRNANIIIDEVYNQAKDKQVKPRVADVRVIDKDITNVLLDYVVKACVHGHTVNQEDYTYTNVNQRTTVVRTEMGLLSDLGIVNDTGKLLNNKRYRQLVAYKNKLDVDMFDTATNRSLNNIKNSLTKALRELKNARLINYSNVIEIVTNPKNKNVYEYDENGEIINSLSTEEKRFIATRSQQDFISYITRGVLDDYNCSNMRQMYNEVSDIRQFYNKVNDNIIEKCLLDENIERFGKDILELKYIEKQFDKILITFTGNLDSLKDVGRYTKLSVSEVEELTQIVIKDSFKTKSNLIDIGYSRDKDKVYNSICKRDLKNANRSHQVAIKKDKEEIKNYKQSATRSKMYPSMAKLTSNIIYSENPVIKEDKSEISIINSDMYFNEENRFGIDSLIRYKSENSGFNELLEQIGEKTFEDTKVIEHELVKFNYKNKELGVWGTPNTFEKKI